MAGMNCEPLENFGLQRLLININSHKQQMHVNTVQHKLSSESIVHKAGRSASRDYDYLNANENVNALTAIHKRCRAVSEVVTFFIRVKSVHLRKK